MNQPSRHRLRLSLRTPDDGRENSELTNSLRLKTLPYAASRDGNVDGVLVLTGFRRAYGNRKLWFTVSCFEELFQFFGVPDSLKHRASAIDSVSESCARRESGVRPFAMSVLCRVSLG